MLNLVSGNYRFASVIPIDDEEFWRRYGGQIGANWEAAGHPGVSSPDWLQLADLIADDCWNNGGLAAFVHGL